MWILRGNLNEPLFKTGLKSDMLDVFCEVVFFSTSFGFFMKKSFLIALSVVAVSANADTLANWTFETSIPTTAGPLSPEAGLQTATAKALGHHASASSVYSNPVGNGSAESFSSTYWAVGDYYQFSFNTVGYKDLAVSFDQASSSTGPKDFKIAYSTDGTTFTNFADYQVLLNGAGTDRTAWGGSTYQSAYSYSFDFSSISSTLGSTLRNQSTVYLRLIDSTTTNVNGGSVATGGTNRVDNFVVTAQPVPEPTSMAALALGGAFFMRRRNKK